LTTPWKRFSETSNVESHDSDFDARARVAVQPQVDRGNAVMTDLNKPGGDVTPSIVIQCGFTDFFFLVIDVIPVLLEQTNNQRL